MYCVPAVVEQQEVTLGRKQGEEGISAERRQGRCVLDEWCVGGWVAGWVSGWVGEWLGGWVAGWLGDWVRGFSALGG